MRLDGIHHVTCITGDAPRNLDFYTRVLGLRLVKKTVNQDDPTVYHLFYADEKGSAGSDLTFFEFPGVPQGRAGAGAVRVAPPPRGSIQVMGTDKVVSARFLDGTESVLGGAARSHPKRRRGGAAGGGRGPAPVRLTCRTCGATSGCG